MTVTFDLQSGNRAIYRRSQLRLLIGDTAEGSGPRIGGGNFDDAELDAFFEMEADSMGRAQALALETLAAEWSRSAGQYRLGPESESNQQAEAFASRAALAREKYGYTLEDDDVSGVVNWERGYENWHGVHRGETWQEQEYHQSVSRTRGTT